MIVVLDASAVVGAQLHLPTRRALAVLAASTTRGVRLIAPELLWSEATSALHALVARGALSESRGRALARLVGAVPVERVRPAALRERAWRIATEMGWARTYDAEYCALAELRGAVLATRDERLVRAAAGRLAYVRRIEDAAAMVGG